jgi:hypothetical protein
MTLKEVKEDYLKDPQSYIKECDDMIISGPPTKHVEFIEDNDIFTKLLSNVKWWEGEDKMHEIEVTVVHSKVEDTIYISNRISLVFINQSGQICLTPENDGVCISKVVLNPNLPHKKGLGTILMTLFYKWLLVTLDELPPMYVECMGHINWGKKLIEYPYSLQTRFFRKFGFRVIEYKQGDGKGLSDYCQMKFFTEKFDIEKIYEQIKNISK